MFPNNISQQTNVFIKQINLHKYNRITIQGLSIDPFNTMMWMKISTCCKHNYAWNDVTFLQDFLENLKPRISEKWNVPKLLGEVVINPLETY